MSLIKTIRDEVVDANVSVASVLRRAKILAATLANAEFKAWINDELNGYTNGNIVPDYRQLNCPVLGHFQGVTGSIDGYGIPVSLLPEVLREDATNLNMTHSVRELESMTQSEDNGWRHPWPTEAVILARDRVQLSGGMVLVEMYQPINNAALDGVIDGIRNRLLDFVLSLQEINGEIMESEAAISELPAEQVASAFQINVYGDNNVVAAQSTLGDISIETIKENDIDSLTKYLEKLDVPEEDCAALATAIKEDGIPEDKKLGKSVGKWIGGMVTKSISGAWKSTVGVGAKLLTDAVFKYYGWK